MHYNYSICFRIFFGYQIKNDPNHEEKVLVFASNLETKGGKDKTKNTKGSKIAKLP